MRLADLARLGLLLRRLSLPSDEKPHEEVIERLDERAPSGMVCDHYLPRRRSRLTVVAVHGVTMAGRAHPDLRHFARSLAASGITCIAPTLPGLASMRFESGDVDRLASFIDEIAREQGRRVVVVGFCYGASYSLLAAARPTVATQVRAVLAFGAYHTLEVVVDGYLQAGREVPTSDGAWDDRIYLDMILAYRHRRRIELPSSAIDELVRLLVGYCHEATLAEKRAFHERHLAALDLLATDRQWLDRTEFDALSPAGKLGGIRCPVGLVHDPSDRLVPASEARRLHRELTGLPGGLRHELLVSELMSHVTLSDALKLGEAAKLLRVLVPLVRGDTDDHKTRPRGRRAPTTS